MAIELMGETAGHSHSSPASRPHRQTQT